MTDHTASTQEAHVNQTTTQILRFLQELLRPLPNESTAAARKRGRPKELASDHLWLAMVMAILRGGTSVACVWRLLTWVGVGSFPVLDFTRDGVRKRLLNEDLSSLHHLLVRVSAALHAWTLPFQDLSLAPFATDILALDQSTLDAVHRGCHDVRNEAKDSPRLLVGKLTGFFDIRKQQWVRLLFRDDVFANEKFFVEELCQGMLPGTLMLADLGYFCFSWFDWLTDQKCWWISRVREKTSYTIAHPFVQQGRTLDALIWLGASRSDRTKHLVRLIQFEHAGTCYRYLTNVLEPHQLSMSEIARLYARRWDIELAFKTLKGEVGLHLWWSSHPKLVIQQLFCALIVAQVLHALHLRVAAEAGVDLFDVSLPILVKLLADAPGCSATQSLIRLLLDKGRPLGLLRPSRRYQTSVPALQQSYLPAPPDLVKIRHERYAHRKCSARSDRSCFHPRFFAFFLI